MAITPMIFIVPGSFAMSLSSDSRGVSKTISLDGKIEDKVGGLHEIVRTPEGRDLSSIPWEIVIHQGESRAAIAQENDCLGFASYHEPLEAKYDIPACAECFTAWLYLPRDRHDEVTTTITRGHKIRRITLAIEGIEYGFAPRGSEKIWDVENTPEVKVAEFSITFGSLSDEGDVESDDEYSIAASPVTQEAITSLENRVMGAFDGLRKSLNWIVWTAILIAAIALLK
ncbi:hypothetical protein [Lysobacter niastensis]|uniref:DUF2167 domain-containing protein n=1 Tax=Lysobacter niastensis TaxID=380629 RepID=A0ABS0B2Z1_9GAMM|nr:hypothetical protein [Lysobacter niastensis]MBF6022855.1 hypothetical protein [Lysobacter niastensis]